MRRSLIRYRTTPERADENERLIKAVFAELAAKSPPGLGYLVLKAGDGSFFHVVANAMEGDSPITRSTPSRPSRAASGNDASTRPSRGSNHRRQLPDAGRRMREPRPSLSQEADGIAAAPESLDALIVRLRPRLHRYCARMTGSAIDGEDVVQDALAKAVVALPEAGPIASPDAWLFRIAHNAALDFLRRRARAEADAPRRTPKWSPIPQNDTARRAAAAASLHIFMRLTVAERSTIILADVLEYSQREVAAVLDVSLASVKASLHRGRSRLRALAQEPDDRPAPRMSAKERSLLTSYVERFNARDFDAIRDMLAAEVRLDLVASTGCRPLGGRHLSRNYARSGDWHFAPALADGRPAAIACEPGDRSARPFYFVMVDWEDGGLLAIRDFRYARYVVDDAEIDLLD